MTQAFPLLRSAATLCLLTTCLAIQAPQPVEVEAAVDPAPGRVAAS